MSSLSQVSTLPVAATADVPELVFPTGLPGLPGAPRFALVRCCAVEGQQAVNHLLWRSTRGRGRRAA